MNFKSVITTCPICACGCGMWLKCAFLDEANTGRSRRNKAGISAREFPITSCVQNKTKSGG